MNTEKFKELDEKLYTVLVRYLQAGGSITAALEKTAAETAVPLETVKEYYNNIMLYE